jgi:hypothetical protein
MPDILQQPACRDGAKAEDLAREAQRAVLYGALMLAQRPSVRLKPAIAQAAQALLPAVRSFLAGGDDAEAAYALDYARACGGDAFLLEKRRAKLEPGVRRHGGHDL